MPGATEDTFTWTLNRYMVTVYDVMKWPLLHPGNSTKLNHVNYCEHKGPDLQYSTVEVRKHPHAEPPHEC